MRNYFVDSLMIHLLQSPATIYIHTQQFCLAIIPSDCKTLLNCFIAIILLAIIITNRVSK